jgi:competence ComEA-like helix-hairpin-helix protein
MDPRVPESGPLPASAQPVVALLTGLGLAGVVTWLAITGRRGLVDHDAPTRAVVHFSVDLNTAGVEELSQLPGLGPTTAARIVEHRQAHGPFTSADALLAVPGIGEVTLDGVRPFLRPFDTSPPRAGESPE